MAVIRPPTPARVWIEAAGLPGLKVFSARVRASDPPADDGLIPARRGSAELVSPGAEMPVGGLVTMAALLPRELLIGRWIVESAETTIAAGLVLETWDLRTSGPFASLPPPGEEWRERMRPLDALWLGIYADFLFERDADETPWRQAAALVSSWQLTPPAP